LRRVAEHDGVADVVRVRAVEGFVGRQRRGDLVRVAALRHGHDQHRPAALLPAGVTGPIEHDVHLFPAGLRHAFEPLLRLLRALLGVGLHAGALLLRHLLSVEHRAHDLLDVIVEQLRIDAVDVEPRDEERRVRHVRQDRGVASGARDLRGPQQARRHRPSGQDKQRRNKAQHFH
jgi:hypothetical protein